MNLRSFLLPAVLSAALAAPCAALAQQAQQPPPPAGASGQTQHFHRGGFMRLFQGVNLTDQQKTQIRQIMQQYRQAHAPGTPPDPQARRQLHDQILNVLTPAQRAQVEQNMQRMRQERQNERLQQRPAPEPSATP